VAGTGEGDGRRVAQFGAPEETTYGFAQAVRVGDPRSPAYSTGLQLNLPPDYLLIHRVTTGAIGVLCQLDGTVPARAIIIEHMPGMRLRHLPPTVD